MCRVTGFWDFKESRSSDSNLLISSMMQCLEHGGPDDSGVFLDSCENLALGHRRLSIIDTTSGGRQPMTHPSDRWVICYNGEVYNFKEIRAELESLGESFRSNSDTEVILYAWAKWGQACLKKFRGMFAFAIWDKQERVLTLVRDRIGVKPLYWYYHDGFFMFASELKAFHKHPKFSKTIDHDAVSLFMDYGYIPSPYCIFKNAHKLEPGHILTINNTKEVVIESYWNPIDYHHSNHHFGNRDDLLNTLEEKCNEAVRYRLVSDVPVGIFLSGGIDSSLVTALAQKQSSVPLKTFTIGFQEASHNEAIWARKVSDYLGTDHKEYYCGPDEAIRLIPKLADIYDEPFGDTSAIPTYLVSKLASSDVKVVLSADGGDEQFAGYYHYQWLEKIKKLQVIPFSQLMIQGAHSLRLFKGLGLMRADWKNVDYRVQKLLALMSCKSSVEAMEKVYTSFQDRGLADLGLKQVSPTRALLNRDLGEETPLFWDLMHYLPDDICVKLDRAAMAVSLEGREPLLDHQLIEWTMGLPYSVKKEGGFQKQLLRDVLYRHIPKEFVDRPKAGFSIPLKQWMQQDLKPLCDEVLSYSAISKTEILNPDSFKLDKRLSKI